MALGDANNPGNLTRQQRGGTPARAGGAPLTIRNLAAVHSQTALVPDAPNNSHRSGVLTWIFRVIDKTSGLILKEHRLMCLPAQYTRQVEARSSVQYTARGFFFDTIGQKGLTRFNAEGHTLFRGQHLPNGVVIDGMASWRDLEDTLTFYFTGDSPKPAISGHETDNLMLTFIDEGDPVTEQQPAPREYVIQPHPDVISMSRRQGQPFLFHYRLSFVGFERDIREELSAQSERLGLNESPRGLFQDLARLNLQMTSINALADGLVGEILGPQGLELLQTARNLISRVNTVVDLVSDFTSGIESVIDSAFELVNSVIADGVSLRNSIVALADISSGGRITGEHAYITNEVRHIRRQMNRLLLFSSGFGSGSTSRVLDIEDKKNTSSSLQTGTSRLAEILNPAGSPFAAAVDTTAILGRFDSLTEIQLSDGDTIDSLAGRLDLPMSVLIAINNMAFPYVDTSQTRPALDPFDDLGRNTYYRNETISIPVQSGTSQSARNIVLLPPENLAGTEGRAFSVEERLFGSDLALSADGDLILDDATGDLVTRVGRDNLVQSIDVGWRLRVGQLNHHPARGNYLKFEIGGYATPNSMGLMSLAALKTLLLNPRLEGVNTLKPSAGAGRFDIRYGVTALGGVRLTERQYSGAGGG